MTKNRPAANAQVHLAYLTALTRDTVWSYKTPAQTDMQMIPALLKGLKN